MTEDSKIVDDDYSKSMLELEKTHAEELLKYESMINEMDLKMLQHVIDYSKLGTKGLFVLNGTAAVSILTIFSNALVKDLSLSNDILISAIIFAIGALCSVVCIILAYFAQIFYQRNSAYNNGMRVIDLLIRQNNDKYHYINSDSLKKCHLTLEKTSPKVFKIINDFENIKIKEKESFKEIANKNLKTGNRIRNVCVTISILSIVLFIWGVVNIKNSFNTPEESTSQITMTNSSYPNVEITPILNKH